jgi:predicted TPR repeat methyltransferase
MTSKTAEELLEGAYNLQTATDNITYYKDFAQSYDEGFADALGYQSPHAVAKIFKTLAEPNDHPIADIGCGTGLTAQALNTDKSNIDGFDISDEMLDKAREKNIYNTLYNADLTQPLDPHSEHYGGLISSGTFTLGHLGPEDLAHLLQILKPNGLVCVTVNTAHFENQGFDAVLGRLHKGSEITQPEIHTVPIYSGEKTHEHSADMMHILSFRKCA